MNDNYEPLNRFCSRIPGAKGADRMAPSTLTRWILRGVKSTTGEVIKLRAVRLGGRWMTTADWFDDFIAELSTQTPGEPIRTPSDIRLAGENAARELQGLGA